MTYWIVDIKGKAIVNEFYLANIVYDKDEKPTISKKPKYIMSYELNDVEGILFDLELLFADKTLYEVFDVDPIAVIKSTKK